MQWSIFIFLLCFIDLGFGSNISSLRSKRAIKSSKLIGGSFYSLCEPPASPKNGGYKCSADSKRMSCTADCLSGFKFPDGTSTKKLTCATYDGIWSPEARFQDCEPICDPPCENGGHCFGNNRCVCAPGFRGDYCQYPYSNCDAGSFFSGSWACNNTNRETLCTVSCPPGMQFDFPPANVYSCDLIGVWTPKLSPKCHSVNVIIHPPPQPSLEPLIIANNYDKIPYSFINSQKKESTCSTWNQLHYKTFGGSLFSFEGKCSYSLARDCASDTFSINIVNDPTCNSIYNCRRKVIIEATNRRYTLADNGFGPEIYSGNERLKIPCTVHGLLAEQVGDNIVIESGLGFKIWWNGLDGVSVEIQNELRNNTCGLCGRIDPSGLPRDMQLVDGSVTTSIVSFANAWKVTDIGEYCPDVNRFEHQCKYDDRENQKISDKAEEACKRIMSREYGVCHTLVDPQPYFEMCRMDFCGCGEADNYKCICSTVSAYFQQCFRLGGKLQNSWRRDDFCEIKCPEGQVFSDCGNACPATCKKGAHECASERCVEGCFCPPNTVLHEDKCINKEECPCFYNGKTYNNGETIAQDCNACVCEQSQWQCTNKKCEGRCSAVGDPHYTTFDGRHYDFMGKCSYYLMYNREYSIEQENVACSGAISEKMGFAISPSSKYPSCTKSVIIRYKGTVVHLKQRFEVTVNGNEILELPISATGIYIYFASSLYMKAKLDNGLVVTWDAMSRVYIDAPPVFEDQTSGLCGTFNRNQKDDYLTTDGDIEQDVNAFANKWKTSEKCKDIALGQILLDPCELLPQRKIEAQKVCGKMKSKAFAGCHEVLDYEPFYRSCMYDMCYCQTKLEDCLCPSLADYAVECSRRQKSVDWRTHVSECGISCPSEQMYQVCGSSCKRSCVDISYNTNCREECVEGCNCPPGTTLNSIGECIPISKCPCVYGGRNFDPGHFDMRGNMSCECADAIWICRPATEKEISEYNENSKPVCNTAANMEYTECAPDCEKTCKNMHSPPSCDSGTCKPGCKCKKGYVYDTKSKRCVLESECPCHHGGKSYSEGETIQEECNSCVCEGGIWNCEKKECPEICQAWGASHFKTFDGRSYEFHGDCDYTLAKGFSETYGKFIITLRNVLCGTSDLTCSKSVIFQIGDEKITFSSERPWKTMSYGERFIMREIGLFIFIHTDIGITLQWDKGTRVYVRADAYWKNKVQGLCGNFNDDESDDYITPDGGLAVVKATTFGDSWRLRDYCPISKLVNNTCELHPNRKAWAQKQCGILKSQLFRSCHSEVPVEPYLERCIIDSCGCDMGGDCECLCTALAAYSQECSRNGVVIKWRSQSLCPIQCEECAQYTGCMSVCPKLTCETEYLYDGIEHSCAKEACVEGCEPKPCPPGQRYNNPREWKCIPDSACPSVKLCKVINGISYNEGQRINDEKVSDMCQSCYCRRGDVVCIGQPCVTTTTIPSTSTTPTPPPTSPAIAACISDGWTNWMSGFQPNLKNKGDDETFGQLRKRGFTFCAVENMTAIECRTVATHKSYKETGQHVKCSLPDGLVCLNKEQPHLKLCQDYELRVFCQCTEITTTTEVASTTAETTTERTTTARTTSFTKTTAGTTKTTLVTVVTTVTPYPSVCDKTGWTEWMNSRDPDDTGDYEIIPELRKKYSFCGGNEIENVECRRVNSLNGRQSHANVECTKDRGLVCKNSLKYYCEDYEVRFYCNCKKGCPMPLGMESMEIYDQQISVSSFKSIETLGNHGRLNGHSAWRTGNIKEPQWIEVNLGKVKEVSGIVTQGHPYLNEWVSMYKIMYSNDGENWQTITSADYTDEVYIGNFDNKKSVTNKLDRPIHSQYIRLVPLEWNEWISLRLELLGCDVEITTTTEYTTTFPVTTSEAKTTQTTTEFETTTTGSPIPPVCKHGWTDWVNIDSPIAQSNYENANGVNGDFELASEHHYFYPFCAHPTTIECRVSGTKTMAHLTGEHVKCDIDGLVCDNDNQNGRLCSDYEVRYFCQCEETTTELVTIAPEVPVISCPDVVTGWTEWMNSNKPQDNPTGDLEDYQSLRAQYSFCEDEALSDIECRVAGTNVSFKETGQLGVTCSLNLGLQCHHSLQQLGVCKDFEVRFYCLCPTTIVSTIATTITTTPPRTTAISETYSVETATPRTHIIESICNDWTPWYNNDDPDDDGVDSELLSEIPNFRQICIKPISYECRSAITWQPSKFSGQTFKEPCNKNGIVCDSVGQQCDDYEIRVYCICPSPTTPKPCETGWTDWFNIDVPYTGEGDTELVEDIRLKHEFCDQEKIKDIQCEARSLTVGNLKIPSRGKGGSGSKIYGKTSGKTSSKGGGDSSLPAFSRLTHPGWIDFTETGDIGVKCSINKGLACVNALQRKNKRCRDYRVRFNCDCGPVTETTPVGISSTTEPKTSTIPPEKQLCGWSSWMNTDNPSSGTGDYETIETLQKQYDICQPEYITDIECRETNSHASWSTSDQVGLICSKKLGFKCDNNQQYSGCLDYEVRVLCNPPNCPLISSTTTEITTTALCLPGQIWSDCAYDCRQMCQSFLRKNTLSNYCNENETCVPGCIYEKCVEPNVWRDESTCLNPAECTCITDEGKLLPPGDFINSGCYRCQCIANLLECVDICQTTTTTSTETSTIACIDEYTDWFSINVPDGVGERENIETIRKSGIEICVNRHVSKIECRDKATQVPFYGTKDRQLTCNLQNGFICENQHQTDYNSCGDYEIRFFCQCVPELTTTTISTTTEVLTTVLTTTSEMPVCNYWSDWINDDKPYFGIGDIENIKQPTEFCQQGTIEAIECVTANSNTPSTEMPGEHLVCSVAQGFKCLNKYQPNLLCDDYKIRYFCGCAATIPPTSPPPAELCPELPEEMAEKCPATCPLGQLCDGSKCVNPADCPCYHDEKQYELGELIITRTCESCICQLKGQSYCYNTTCPMCSYGKEGLRNEKCECECKTCPSGELLCSTNLECLKEDRWCDGVVDCPDDEVDCPTTTIRTTTETTARTTTCQSIIPTCSTGEELVETNPSDACPEYACVKLPPIIPSKNDSFLILSTCSMLSNSFTTFDNFTFDYDICEHVLMKDRQSNRFYVTINKDCKGKVKGCQRYLFVSQDNHKVKILDGKVEYDGQIYSPTQLSLLAKNKPDLTVKHIGSVIIVTSKKYHFVVRWLEASHVEIEVNQDLKTQIFGLCGYFNGDVNDDKMTPNGEEVNDVVEFGDSWNLIPLEQCVPSTCPPDIALKAEAACNELRLKPFDSCNGVVDPTSFINACKSYMCDCLQNGNSSIKDCRCKAYLPYVEACEIKNIIEVRYWRVKQSCLPDCPPGLVWHDSGPACERTCENMVELHEKDECPHKKPVPGCFCPTGLVRKGDHCVKAEKCEDCVCKGYGDPHYYTFDGSYFPFQGNCTYILARDIIPKGSPESAHKFQVYATNEDCFEEPLTTCTVAIMIIYNDHIAHFRVNESVTFDGVQLFPVDFPFHAHGIHIESIPGRSVTFSVFDAHLVVRYFELNYGFEIRLPSEVYYNKTEGLCGNCNFNNSDDFVTKEGKLTNNTDEFGFSWVAKPPEQFESINEICLVKLEINETCKNSIELEMCNKLLQDPFTSCHAIINPERYMNSCQFDMCHSVNPKNSLCRSAAEYTRKCAEVGICIENWRTPDFCPYKCPSGMYYKQCGSTCPKSCKDIVQTDWEPSGRDIPFFEPGEWSLEQTLQELLTVCDSTPVDGCFCHESKVLKDGQCVDPVLCKTCDDNGHKIGDYWQPNPCTSCHCTMTLTAECVKTQCPAPPTCPSDQYLRTTAPDNSSCCNNYTCELGATPAPCPTQEVTPQCKSGELVKMKPNANNCPEFYCECDVFQCPSIQQPTNLEVGEEARLIKDGCCPRFEVICATEKCPPKPSCSKFHELKEKKYSIFKCCPEFSCELQPNVCVYNHEYEMVDGYQQKYEQEFPQKVYKAGDIWMDGLCRNCTCESDRGLYKQKCVVELCSRLDDYKDKGDYNWKTNVLPNICCPKYVRESCIYQGVKHEVGDDWPSSTDKCKRYRCGTLPTREAVKVERFITCDRTCREGYEYFEPSKDSDDCCGECKPVACNDNGVWYKVGAVWNSTTMKCYTAECISNFGVLQTISSGPVCPLIKPNCKKRIWDAAGCCEICKDVIDNATNCGPVKVQESLTVEMIELSHVRARCTNKFPLKDMMSCAGTCSSKSVYDPDTNDFVSTCHCCTPSKLEKKTIYLNCTDGIPRPSEYSVPRECECTICAAGNSKYEHMKNLDSDQIVFRDF
ncbi:hypothetical protein CHUAL_007413 [Chamberlinius hualienensis]